MKRQVLPLLMSIGVALAPAHHATACAPDALGTARTLTLKREFAGYGSVQYGKLPLAQGEVALTFDDGPRPETLPRVLAALQAECVQATFFMTGANLAQSPELARRVVAQGHTAALHSYSHPFLPEMTAADQLADLEKGIQAYHDALGGTPPAYRFPYLQQTPVMLDALKAKQMMVASIDVGIDDYAPNDMSSAALVNRLVSRLEGAGGGIVLMHDANGPTADALPALLQALKAHGYKVVQLRWE